MRWCKPLLLAILITGCCKFTFAQHPDSLLLSQTETELSFGDSLSIFYMIDSLLQQGDLNTSQLALRVSYNSNVLSTGRTLGIENFGLSPGVSYYHKSGLFADVRLLEPQLWSFLLPYGSFFGIHAWPFQTLFHHGWLWSLLLFHGRRPVYSIQKLFVCYTGNGIRADRRQHKLRILFRRCFGSSHHARDLRRTGKKECSET